MATSEIILFLDSDVILTPGIIREHVVAYASNYVENVESVAGITKFVPNANRLLSASVVSSGILISFEQPLFARKLEWSPTSNLSFTRKAITEIGFDTRFPAAGGGEDILIGLQLSNRGGQMLGASDSIALHSVWPNWTDAVGRFFRWGFADGILVRICREEKVHPIDFRFPSISLFLFVTIIASGSIWIIEDQASVMLAPVFFLIGSLLTSTVKQFFSDKGNSRLLACFLGNVLKSIFDIGWFCGALRYSSGRDLFHRIVHFPPEVDTLRRPQLSDMLSDCAFVVLVLFLASLIA